MTNDRAGRLSRQEIGLAAAWVPFAVAAVVLPDSTIRWYALGVLLLSLAHQPLTLGLVYADERQLAQRRRFFIWAPVVLGLVIMVGLQISFLLVAAIGGLWNTEHTLMQRYGLTRIYRRQGGDTRDGRLDLMLLVSWLVVVLARAVQDPSTPDRIETLGLGTANERSLQLLVDIRPVATLLVIVSAAFALVTTWRWLAREIEGGFTAGAPVYTYVGGTAALFLVATVHPIAGLLGWVGSHAVEYFVIVGSSLEKRRGTPGHEETRLGRLTRSPRHIAVFVLGCSAVGSAVVLLAQFHAGLTLYGLIFFSVGGLHILYDGVIWKLRRPEVAASLSIDARPVEVAR